MRKLLILILVALVLPVAVPATEARPAAAKKCGVKRVYPEAYNGAVAPVGRVRVRRIPCRTARSGMASWFDAYQERIRTGRRANVTYIEAGDRFFRCVYRQTPFGTDKNGNPINPYAVVKCRARGGVRLYFEGYA